MMLLISYNILGICVVIFGTLHTHTHTHTYSHTHCECVIYLILANDYGVKMYAAIEFVSHNGYIILHFAR